MSTPMAETPKRRRVRRRFDDDFKAQAVRLVLDEGQERGAVARDLDLTETALREWVHRARANRTRGRTGLTTAEREELARLRKENRQLRLEREILKNVSLTGDVSECPSEVVAADLNGNVWHGRRVAVTSGAGVAATGYVSCSL